jgi:hypothetical protein
VGSGKVVAMDNSAQNPFRRFRFIRPDLCLLVVKPNGRRDG